MGFESNAFARRSANGICLRERGRNEIHSSAHELQPHPWSKVGCRKPPVGVANPPASVMTIRRIGMGLTCISRIARMARGRSLSMPSEHRCSARLKAVTSPNSASASTAVICSPAAQRASNQRQRLTPFLLEGRTSLNLRHRAPIGVSEPQILRLLKFPATRRPFRASGLVLRSGRVQISKHRTARHTVASRPG